MIFKTFDSSVDKISSKWGIFGRSFNSIGAAICDKIISCNEGFEQTGKIINSWRNSESIWSRLYPSRKNIESQLIDVNKLIPEIDEGKAFEILEFIKSIEDGTNEDVKSFQELYDTGNKTKQWIAEYAQSTKDQIRSTKGVIEANQQARDSALAHNEAIKSQTLSAKAQSAALKGLTFTLNALASIGLSVIASKAVSFIYDMFTANENLLNNAKELSSAFQQEQNSIEDYKDRIAALQSTINDSSSSFDDVSEARKKLMAVQDELIRKFGTEKETIETITGAINGQSDAWDLLTKKQYQQWKNNFNKKSFGESAADFFWGENIEAAFDRLIDLDLTGAWNNLTRPGPSNIDKMVSSMQYAHYELKKSGNDALDSLIAKTYGLQNSGSTFVLHGNLNDIYDDLLGIQELARHFNVSDAFEAEAERIANAMYKSLEGIRRQETGLRRCRQKTGISDYYL